MGSETENGVVEGESQRSAISAKNPLLYFEEVDVG